MFDILKAAKTILRILTFRAEPEEFLENSVAILVVGLILTWLVGIGRWWDDPRDLMPFVRWGIGSVFYVIALSLVLWIISLPFRDRKFSYLSFAAFVGATSPPAVVYALPIERWTDMETAATYNLCALAFVSLYRIALLGWFSYRILKTTVVEAVILTGLPITVISFALTALGHGARVMDIMGGLRDRMAKSDMEVMIGVIGCLSFVLGPAFLLAYFVAWLKRNPA